MPTAPITATSGTGTVPDHRRPWRGRNLTRGHQRPRAHPRCPSGPDGTFRGFTLERGRYTIFAAPAAGSPCRATSTTAARSWAPHHRRRSPRGSPRVPVGQGRQRTFTHQRPRRARTFPSVSTTGARSPAPTRPQRRPQPAADGLSLDGPEGPHHRLHEARTRGDDHGIQLGASTLRRRLGVRSPPRSWSPRHRGDRRAWMPRRSAASSRNIFLETAEYWVRPPNSNRCGGRGSARARAAPVNPDRRQPSSPGSRWTGC